MRNTMLAQHRMRNIILQSYTPQCLTNNKIDALAHARTSPETLRSPRRYPSTRTPVWGSRNVAHRQSGRRRWQDDWHKGRGGAILKEVVYCTFPCAEGKVRPRWRGSSVIDRDLSDIDVDRDKCDRD